MKRRSIQFARPASDQRNLGMSMKVERSTLDQVKQRFELLKRKKEEEKKEYDVNQRLQELQEEVGPLVFRATCACAQRVAQAVARLTLDTLESF